MCIPSIHFNIRRISLEDFKSGEFFRLSPPNISNLFHRFRLPFLTTVLERVKIICVGLIWSVISGRGVGLTVIWELLIHLSWETTSLWEELGWASMDLDEIIIVLKLSLLHISKVLMPEINFIADFIYESFIIIHIILQISLIPTLRLLLNLLSIFKWCI